MPRTSSTDLRQQKQHQILQIVSEAVESLPEYKTLRNPPLLGDKEYVGVVSRLLRKILSEKYQKLEGIVDPPPLTTIKGWFYKGFPPEIVLLLFR